MQKAVISMQSIAREAAYQHQQSSSELVDAAGSLPHIQCLISPRRVKSDAMQKAVITMQYIAREAAHQHQQSSLELVDAAAPG